MLRLSYDLVLWPACSTPWVNLLAQISTSYAREKPRKSFFLQNGTENYFRFQFSTIFLFSTLDLVISDKNLKNFSGALFWDIWGQSWKLQKLFKWVTRISQLAIFWYSLAVAALYHCAKIHSLSFSNKLSTEVAVLGLSRFLADFSCFWAPKSLRLYISKTKPATPTVFHIPR